MSEGAWFCHTRQKSLYKPLLPLLSNYHVFLNYAHLSTDIPFSTAGEGAKWAAGKLFLKSYVCSRLLLEAQRVRTEQSSLASKIGSLVGFTARELLVAATKD